MHAERKRVLILCKTYPSPSSTYVETSCVAGMDESGKLIRLFPVPFRLVSDEQQFKKWQWIEARVRKAREDNRPESHRISVDTIEVLGDPIPYRNEWAERRHTISPVPIFDSFLTLDTARESEGITLGLLRPKRIIDLLITKADSSDWSEDERAKLMQAQTQGSLFDQDAELKSLKLLQKLPFDFHYITPEQKRLAAFLVDQPQSKNCHQEVHHTHNHSHHQRIAFCRSGCLENIRSKHDNSIYPSNLLKSSY